MVNDTKKISIEGRLVSTSKKQRTKMSRGQTVFLFTMLTIPVLHWAIFWLYVNVNSIVLAFQTPFGEPTLNNFKRLFLDFSVSGSVLTIALKNTLIYFSNNLLVITPLALMISYFMFHKILGTRALRVIFYLPGIISSVALTTIFSNFMASSGPLGAIIEALGGECPQLLADSRYATGTIVLYCIWTGFGTNMLLFTGAMSRIPIEIIESAKLDGCKMGKEITHIILPLIWPTLSTLLIFQATALFSASGPILLFTKGDFGTTTIGYWIFKNVYEDPKDFQIVSAAGLFFTLIGVPIILTIRWLIEKVPNAEY